MRKTKNGKQKKTHKNTKNKATKICIQHLQVIALKFFLRNSSPIGIYANFVCYYLYYF